jgi:signal transduction histidine kinase
VNSFNLSIQFKISTSDEMIKFIKNFKLPIEGEFLKSIYKKSKVVPILFKEKISLILPLLHKDQVQGMILLGNKLSKKGWSQKELDLLSLFSKHASAALSRAVMAEELKEAERIMARSQKLIALGELSAGIAHEIRNPLGIISASAETLQKNHINNKTRKEISKFILDEVNRLNKFINNFLNFARPSKPHFSFFNIRDVIKKCAALIYDKATKQNIKIIINCDPKISSIYSDQHQLGQLLINLMLNSIEAMPNGGEIKITSRISGKNKLAIEIQDTGCGISPDIREKIFNPFFTTKERGTGLGLSVASRIAQNLGGMLSFDSEEGRGTIFRIYLPIKHES